MSPLFKKLNLISQSPIVVVNAPNELEPALAELRGVAILRSFGAVQRVTYSLAFVTTLAQVSAYAKEVAARAVGDAVVWFAYPKSSSKRYACAFNRDTGWAALGQHGFEPVRQVAIDEDWSALRFRRVEHIKSIKRNPAMALSEAGRKRAARARKS